MNAPANTTRPAILTRADRLIQGAEVRSGRRCGQDEAVRLAYEVGLLRDEIKNLCAELDVYRPLQKAGLTYVNLTLDRGVPVFAGFACLDDELDIEEVWCGGLEIGEHIRPEVMGSLRQQALAAHKELRSDARAEAQIEARIEARDFANWMFT